MGERDCLYVYGGNNCFRNGLLCLNWEGAKRSPRVSVQVTVICGKACRSTCQEFPFLSHIQSNLCPLCLTHRFFKTKSDRNRYPSSPQDPCWCYGAIALLLADFMQFVAPAEIYGDGFNATLGGRDVRFANRSSPSSLLRARK